MITHRIRSMDLLRSIAILWVLLAHSVLAYGAPPALAPLQLGGIGVDLFFVLSGWLLGGHLCREAKADGIAVRRFWVRRWWRTLPAYYVVLALTITQRALQNKPDPLQLDYLFFVQNYFPPLDYFYVSWSLAVEEQFYLAVAPVMWLLFKIRNGRYLLPALGFMLLMPLVFRLAGLHENPIETHVRVDGCIAGVMLAALAQQRPKIWNILCNHSGWLASLGLAVLATQLLGRYIPALHYGALDKLPLVIIFCSWILYANATESLRQYLYIPGAWYVATRSYSVYLLHPEVLAVLDSSAILLALPFPVFLTLALIGSLAAAEVLYRAVELPFMRFRDRHEIAKARVTTNGTAST